MVLYDAAASKSAPGEFACKGYGAPVVGTVYPRASLEWDGIPLGGLGTGYVAWDTDGRFGHCSVFNDAVTPPKSGTIPFRLTVGKRQWALAMRGEDGAGDLYDMRYFGHYPVADAQFIVDSPVSVEVRAYGAFLPGDSNGSNVPAAVFCAYLTNNGETGLTAGLSFTTPAAPTKVTDSRQSKIGGWNIMTATHPDFAARPRVGLMGVTHEFSLATDADRLTCGEYGITGGFEAELAPGKRSKGASYSAGGSRTSATACSRKCCVTLRGLPARTKSRPIR